MDDLHRRREMARNSRRKAAAKKKREERRAMKAAAGRVRTGQQRASSPSKSVRGPRSLSRRQQRRPNWMLVAAGARRLRSRRSGKATHKKNGRGGRRS
jgi:hypothetical protein